MRTNNKPFLESYKDLFQVGDIIWWYEWKTTSEEGYISKMYYGAIIEIRIKKNLYSERSVYVADVLPFGKTRTREISLHLLNKRTI
jgi:hypothetical protein